jgi:hypothetical protein
MSKFFDHAVWRECSEGPSVPQEFAWRRPINYRRIMIQTIQKQIADFLDHQGQDSTRKGHSYLIDSGIIVGIRTDFAQAAAIWMFTESDVHVYYQDSQAILAIETRSVNEAA